MWRAAVLPDKTWQCGMDQAYDQVSINCPRRLVGVGMVIPANALTFRRFVTCPLR
jgi:hypothetical protein